ncbi:MAG TPA: HEAT repeat domain-containing protein, partial [Kofleriaceae bacterium]
AALTGLAEFPLRSGKYNLDEAIALLPGELPRPVAASRLVIDHAGDIAAGLSDALAQHRDVIVAVLEDLDAAQAQISLGALAPVTAVDSRLEAALATIGQAIEPGVTAQIASDDPKARALAVSVLAKLDTGKPAAGEAIARALGDTAEQVRGAAMNAIVVLAARRGAAPPALVQALVEELSSPTLGDRMNAAVALGRLGGKGNLEALVGAAGDPSGFVREAVAQALANVPSGIDALLTLSRDEIYQVRAAAARSLGTLSDPRGHKRRGELTSDPDPSVRAAAGGS